MATDPNKLSLSRLYSKARELFVPVVEKYNQVNSSYQKVNNPNVRQMYNQLPQRLEPVRRTYNTVNQGLKQASAYRQAVPLQQRVQIARQDMRVNPIKYSLPGQIAQLPNRPAQVFGKAYEGTLEGLSAGLIDIPARPSQNNLERGAYVGGSLLGMLNPSSPLMRGGKLLSKAPVISQTQRPLGQLAGRLIAQGGGRKLAGKALANVSQGIPYTAAYMAGKQALSPLTGQGYTKGDLATDVGFDAAIGAGAGLLGVGAPLAMGLTKSAKNLPNPKVKLKSPKPPTDPLEALKVEAGKRTKKQVKEDIAKYFYGNRADFNQWNIDVSKDSRIGITLKPEFEKGIRGEMVGEGKKISDVIQELKSDIKSTESFANRINEDVSKGLLSQTEGVEAKISILERGQEATRLYNELLELKPYKSKYISPKANENYFDSQILELKKQLQPNIPTQSQLPKVDPPEALKVEAGKYKNADIKQFFDKNYDKLPQKDQRVLDKVIYGMRGDYNGDAYLLPKEQKVIDRLLGGQNVGATQTKKVTSTTNKTNVFPSFNEYYSLTGGYKGVSQGRDVTGDYINGVIDQLNTGGKKNSGYGIPTAENIEDARNIIKTHSLRRDSDLARLENAISNYNQSQLPKADPLEALKVEARKYKSAEEFTDKYKLLRGGEPFDKSRVGDKGVSFTKSDSIANTWKSSRKGGVKEEFYLSPDAKILETGGVKDRYDKQDWLNKGYGYDAINLGGVENEIRVLNPDKILTKSQLTDLWEKNAGKTSTNIGRGIQVSQTSNDLLSKHTFAINGEGYPVAKVNGRVVPLHELVMGTEKAKGFDVDHINGNKLDNRVENLRVISHKANSVNTKISKANTSGIKGVQFDKTTGKWVSRITVDNKNVHLGSFPTVDDAVKARKAAESKYFEPLHNQSQLPKSKVKVVTQTTKGKIPVLPETKTGTTQPPAPLVNAPQPLMSQGMPANQLLQSKKQQGKLPLNDQEKVQPQALDNIIAEGRRSIGSAKQEPGRPVKQVLNDLYTQWVDRYHPLSRASKQAKVTLKVKGAELRPEYDPDYLVRRLTGAGGIADSKFNTELKPIIDEVDQLGIPKLDMDTYLAHKRMAGFGDVDREIIGADPIKSKQITTALEAKYPEISGVADKLYRYQDQGLQELVDAGFISPDAVKTIRSQNPDYAPLYRVMDEMDEYLGLPTRKTMQGKNPVVKIKGSKRQIESPVESIIGNTFRQRAAIEKNRVAQSIIGLNKVADMGFNKVAKSGNDTITVWNNGVKEYWQVGSDIADVAKGVNEEVTNTLLKVIQAPAQLLRQGATGRNPSFMIPNIVRDQIDAGITSKYGYIPFVDYVSGLKSMLKNDAVYQKWQNSGAKIDLGELSGKKSVAKLFDEKKSKKRLTDWLVDSLDVMGKYSEQPTRVGLFKKAYNKTGNELLSAMESRDATVDFARMGSKMKVANSIIPFLNVGVQGFDKLVRATKNNPKKVLLNMGIYGATPAIAVTAYNLQNFPKEYEEIPQYEKDSNFVIVKGRNAEGVVDYFTIPKGNIVPVVANPIQSFMEYLAGVDGKSFSELAVNLVSETLPVLEGGNTPREVLVKTTGSMIPQFAKPIIEDITNKSFFKYDAKKEAQGKESGVIVPNYLKKKEPYQQTYEFTPQMYQKIGAVLNVSPLRVKNLMEGYLAGYAKIPVQITEMMNAVSRGEPISPNDKTVLSRFIKQTYPSSSTQRPVETKDTPGLMDRVIGKADASTTPVSIPTDQETFNELYKKALSNGTDFPMEKTLIENDPTLTEDEKVEKIAKLREKTAQWAETLITMQDKHPEKVFGAELKTYGSNSSYKVPERADWIESQLDKAKTDTEIRDMLDQMWEAGVLTTGKTGTAQELIDRGLNVYAIGNKVGTKSKKAKSGSTKVKKVKIPALKKIAIKSVKYPKVKIVKSKSGNFKAPKVKKIKIRRFAKAKIG